MIKRKHKEGAASFYIVAFSTLIMVIIAASFTAVVLSDMARSENDELSQSAYDAALAGVEDAKLAYYNYQKCLESNSEECERVKNQMKNPNCDMVGRILGRIGEGESGEVLVEETTTSNGTTNNMQQAYTCVIIETSLSDYRSSLTEHDTMRVVRIRLGNRPNGAKISANEINKIKISWYSNTDVREANTNGVFKYTNFNNDKIEFPTLKNSGVDIAVPPMIAVGLVQTAAGTFSLEDFNKVGANQTNRGTVYLVPTDNKDYARRSKETAYNNDFAGNYIGAYDGSENVIKADNIVKSNDQSVKNLPFGVYCPGLSEGNEFACSTILELPKAYGGGRNDDTFMLTVMLPYGQPSTKFALEFFCENECGSKVISSVSEDGETVTNTSQGTNQAMLNSMQVKIDSTGRANNLYRRVETRLEGTETNFPFPLYAIELLGNNNSNGLLQKPMTVLCEYQRWSGFAPTC